MNGHEPATSDSILVTAENLRWKIGQQFHDSLMESMYQESARIADHAVSHDGKKSKFHWDQHLDRILIDKWTGIPVMVLLLALVFWLTIVGANYPSRLIADLLIGVVFPALKAGASFLYFPGWLSGILFDGMYLAAAWVVSVMLPPMAIFFPMFTVLEDFGYLPRVAFNLDNLFRKAGAHGKQALSMSMGYGCNAAGIIATRIIDSPRERLIAIITNNFALCNGRWPTQILMATLFIGSLAPPAYAGLVSAGAVLGVTLLGVGFTFVISWGLSRTVLKGEASSFSLELPPYRPPKIMQILYTSLVDRTLFVLWRAVVFAVPAGGVIWLVANLHIGDMSIAEQFIHLSNPLGLFLGLNGVILLAYIIAIPANEIVVPTILMLTVLSARIAGYGSGAGVLFEVQDTSSLMTILTAGGWTTLTAVNLMLFSLLHNPCSTTIYTIYKETGSVKWATVSTSLPIVLGLIVTFLVKHVWSFLQ